VCFVRGRERERETGIEREKRKERENKGEDTGVWRYDHNSTIYKNKNYLNNSLLC